MAAKVQWTNPAEMKRQFTSTVDFVGDNRMIFYLGANKQIAGDPARNLPHRQCGSACHLEVRRDSSAGEGCMKGSSILLVDEAVAHEQVVASQVNKLVIAAG